MMNWYLGNYWYLLLLLLLPLLGIIIYQFVRWKTERKDRFAEARFQQELFAPRRRFTKFFPVLYLLATFFLILSIVDLLSGSEEIKTKQKMNNVIFLLDVSNSMNAQDVEPNRLDAAKNLIISVMNEMKNDRVGLVVFAGEAASIMPLTTDFTAAETYIGGIETQIVKIQGTDFLAGMRVVTDKFKNIEKGARKVVILSDGEDNESNEKAAQRLAAKEGITAFTVGIGSEEGAPIPEYVFGQLMGYKSDISGQTVISKRQVKALQNLASATGGSYIDGNNLDNAAAQLMSDLRRNISSSETYVKSKNAIHYYAYFLSVSLILFLIIIFFNPNRDFNL